MRAGSASRSVHNKAWASNSSRGSRISTQRNGTAGKPVEYQTAVSETISTGRSVPPYQPLTVIGVQAVRGSSSTAERFGRRGPFRRGLPIWRGLRGRAGLYRAASSLRRVMKVIGFLSLRQRSRSFSEAYPPSETATIRRCGCQRLTSKSSCQAHSVSGLWRLPRSAAYRSEGARAQRNGKAPTP